MNKSAHSLLYGIISFIMHSDKEYYDNGEEKIESDIVLSSLKSITQKQYTTGKEDINGKSYYYEEYENENMDFIIFIYCKTN